MVTDILDVWFDSGSTHTFTLEDRPDLKWPADVYLEGSDQHRGWFHSSLLESCGTRGRAPYDTVVTHGFTMDEDGRKMSKSLGNTVVPQDVMKQSGADILRLWVVTTDYWEDQRLGKNDAADQHRRLPQAAQHASAGCSARWRMTTATTMPLADMPELERLMLHRLAELDQVVRAGYDAFDFKRITRALIDFMVSSCRPSISTSARTRSTATRRRARSARRRSQVVRHLFDCLVTWLAPMLPFTTEEAWLRPLSRTRSRCISSSSRPFRPTGTTRRWRRSGARSGRCAASSPARWRSSARRRRSARRWRPRRSSTSTDAELLAGARRRRPGRDLHHQRSRHRRTARRRPAPSRLPTCRAWPSSSRRPRIAA